MRERNDECRFTVPFRCLSLQFVVCFCSVVHRTVCTSARALSHSHVAQDSKVAPLA